MSKTTPTFRMDLKIRLIINREEPKLRKFIREEGETPVDLFKVEIGHFGPTIPATEMYLFHLSGKGASLKQMADETLRHPSMEKWERIRFICQEHLRLCTNDDYSIRYSFPFVLINCNLDDKAYAFARCFILGQDDCDVHHGTEVGDWVYPTEDGCRYQDINRSRKTRETT